jgi:hypothetical protein
MSGRIRGFVLYNAPQLVHADDTSGRDLSLSRAALSARSTRIEHVLYFVFLLHQVTAKGHPYETTSLAILEDLTNNM